MLTQFTHIAREGDFNDFIKYEPVNRLRELEVRLENAVRQLAGTRTQVTEFLQKRLTEVRLALKQAA